MEVIESQIMLMNMGTLIVSPHADDTDINCTGLLFKNILPNPVRIATVFSLSEAKPYITRTDS